MIDTRLMARVAVVGRPNVGKSSLVNRIIGTRAAIVEERPGVTRDRRELVAEWNGRPFVLVDTGGWLRPGEAGLTAEPPALAAKVTAQAEAAMSAADLVLLVVDVTTGITEEDARVAKVLQRGKVPVMVVANKVDAEQREVDTHQFMRLGLGEPYPVSAIHGRLSGELLDAIVAALPEPEVEAPPDPAERDGIFSVAIVGRPNVGKSTLFNRMVGEERSVVHDLPGTTRDAIDTVVETDDGPLRFVDTAGLRRKSQIDEPAEYYSLVRALEAIDRADAALFLVDASEGVTNQDQRLAERVDAAGTAVVIVLNKWDQLDTEGRARRAPAGGRQARVPLVRAGAPDLRAHRPARAPSPPRAARGGGGVPRARSHGRAQPGAARRAGIASTADRQAAPSAGPVRNAGRHRSAHVHPLRDAGASASVPSLPRAQTA